MMGLIPSCGYPTAALVSLWIIGKAEIGSPTWTLSPHRYLNTTSFSFRQEV